MKVVKGNKTLELTAEKFADLAKGFKKIVVDLGTGDGRFVYKNALQDPYTLYIGIDPAEKQMESFSKKALKKRLGNVLFVPGSFELYPKDLEGLASHLYVTLPWGSLLKAAAESSLDTVKKFANMLHHGSILTLIFGYDLELEPSQTSRLDLEPISFQKVGQEIVPKFVEGGFELLESFETSNAEINKLESTWGKRISTTKERVYFNLVLRYL